MKATYFLVDNAGIIGVPEPLDVGHAITVALAEGAPGHSYMVEAEMSAEEVVLALDSPLLPQRARTAFAESDDGLRWYKVQRL